MRFLLAGFLCALLSAGLLAAQGDAPKSALDKATLEAFVRHLLLWNDKIKVEISDPKPSKLDGFLLVTATGHAGAASQEQSFYVSKDGRQVVRAIVFDIAKNPFQEDIDKITTTFQPSLGTPGAPVKIVIFTDFECPFCKREGQMLRSKLIQAYPEQVRLYFKDFPLESIHPWSRAAAMAGRCFYAQSEDAFWAYHDWVFDKQSEITKENLRDKVVEFGGTLEGIDVLRLTSCIDTKETEEEVDDSIAEARALKVNSTPTLFINGRRIGQQLPWANLKQIIDFELNYQKTAHNAGDEDCCAVKLPTPLSQ